MTIFEWLSKRDITVKNKKLVEQAFIHSSYVNEHRNISKDNERLEFMATLSYKFGQVSIYLELLHH